MKFNDLNIVIVVVAFILISMFGLYMYSYYEQKNKLTK